MELSGRNKSRGLQSFEAKEDRSKEILGHGMRDGICMSATRGPGGDEVGASAGLTCPLIPGGFINSGVRVVSAFLTGQKYKVYLC